MFLAGSTEQQRNPNLVENNSPFLYHLPSGPNRCQQLTSHIPKQSVTQKATVSSLRASEWQIGASRVAGSALWSWATTPMH